MANANFWQRGEALDYINSTENKIAANTIVKIGDRLGVTGCDIAPGAVGSLHVCGVFEMPKTGTSAIAMGQNVYWDGSGITDAADDGGNPATAYTKAGYAAAAAAADATKIMVQIGA